MEGYVKEIKLLETEIFHNALGLQLQGCNLNCPFCPKYDDRVFDEIFAIDNFILKTKLKEFEFDTVVVFGGEPLIQDLFLKELINLFKNNELWLITNLTKPDVLKEIIKLKPNINLVVRWWSFDNLMFNRLTNVKGFFQSEKIILYDIIKSLYILKKNSIMPWFLFTLVPGIFYTKDHIFNELDFLSNFGLYPKIIITQIDKNNARGRWKNLNLLSEQYINNLLHELEKQGFKAIYDPLFP